jgi:hypothetical protein
MKTNKKIVIIATSIILATFLAFATINEQTSAAIALAKQMTFGGGAGDFAQAVAMWGTKKVIVGYTYSFVLGHSDVFVAVNDTTLGMWTFGTSMDEQAFAVAIHGNFAYIVGTINYFVPPNINYFDIFVAKWDLLNNQLLEFKAIGRNQAPLADVAFAVAADANFVFVTGRWADDKAFLAILHAPSFSLVKFLELDILSTSNEFAYAVDFTVSGSTYIIIVGGATNAPGFGDYDAFLARIDFDGVTATKIWALKFGTAGQDGVTSIKFVSPTTFAVGGTLGGNGFIGYFTIDGGFLKARATVFSSTSIITSLAWNGTHLAAAGFFSNPPNQDDAYVLLIDRNGLLVDAKGYGGGTIDRAHGVAIDTSSNIHVVGITSAYPNAVFTLTPPSFTYKEVQVVVILPATPPYLRMVDITSGSGSLSVSIITPDVNPLTPPVFPRTPTFNNPVNGDAFYVRFTT